MHAGSHVIIGRAAELRRVDEFLVAVEEGPSGLLIEGEIGAGKTTLWTAGLSAATAVPALLMALKDPHNEETDVLGFGVNAAVINALQQREAPPAVLVPALIELLPRAQADVRTLSSITIALGRLESQAAPAVPALIESLKRADRTEFRGGGGPAGSPVIHWGWSQM